VTTNEPGKSIKRSLELWTEAENLIPGGSQLVSRRPQMFAFGVTPIFAERAKGAYFWDVDGNRYLDMTMAVGAVLLGYCDSDIEKAVDEQQRKSTIFSILHPIEIEMARLLIEILPCAEMVRFGKSGGEANAVAVRIARAFTGRDKVAFCGYHGWHDWYLSANLAGSAALDSHLLPGVNARGVPKALKGTNLPFEYNNIDSLKRIFDENSRDIACVIMEASRIQLPSEGFLQQVQNLARENGALLIFDEVVTGFRLSLGGAQQLYGVTPDLATYGKTIANGYPLTAIAGRREVMEISKNLFISSTFWDDNCSLAAGVATVKKMKREGVAERVAARGCHYMREWQRLADRLKISAKIMGTGPSSSIVFEEVGSISRKQLITLYVQEMARRGIFGGPVFNICLSHGDAEIGLVLDAAEKSLAVLSKVQSKADLNKYLVAEEQSAIFARRMV
jgi:glutamate-1-semialdehyde 2,1-aminomutase